jgi:hypothetical protein
MFHYISKLTKYLFLINGFLFNINSFAIDTSSIEQNANTSIHVLYQKLTDLPKDSMAEKINVISAQFISLPYVLGALGDGSMARFDQFPLYRTDAFDCDTYVNTVLALALSDSLSTFQHCIRHVRYKNGHVGYIYRNHFTSIDWNKNNQNDRILKDITLDIKNQNQQPIAKFAETLINKPSWYEHLPLSTIRLQQKNIIVKKLRLAELKASGRKFKATLSTVPYLPLSVLFTENLEPKTYLFAQIPHGAIIEIIRLNWNLGDKIGTALDVSHLGFAIWKDGALYFRQASSTELKVTDVLLIDYLRRALTSPTIKGINVQIVVPQNPIYC